MTTVKAAVVTSYDEPPRYLDFDMPAPTGSDQELLEVLAAGLHPRVRSGAAGRHYSSTGALPMVPGVDGVARLADGSRVYFLGDDELPGSMAERTVIDRRRSIPLPAHVDEIAIAAAMNPAMSSWVALRRRVPIDAGQSVLVLGATGNAGRMAIQVAKLLGAGHVIGAGRNVESLSQLGTLGADDVVRLGDDSDATVGGLARVAAEVDIVIDYLWGTPAEQAMVAMLTARSDRSRALDWIQIGAVAGPTMSLPSVALRSANLRVQGVGQGSVSTAGYRAELVPLVEEISAGQLSIETTTVALRDIEMAWQRPELPGVRAVVVPR